MTFFAGSVQQRAHGCFLLNQEALIALLKGCCCAVLWLSAPPKMPANLLSALANYDHYISTSQR